MVKQNSTTLGLPRGLYFEAFIILYYQMKQWGSVITSAIKPLNGKKMSLSLQMLGKDGILGIFTYIYMTITFQPACGA